MSPEPFVPDDFDPPRELKQPDFHLVPLGAQHNESDHAAWIFTVLRPGTEEVVGCLYVYPAKEEAGAAQVRSWVRAGVARVYRVTRPRSCPQGGGGTGIREGPSDDGSAVPYQGLHRR